MLIIEVFHLAFAKLSAGRAGIQQITLKANMI
jgi:hypothetical protein